VHQHPGRARPGSGSGCTVSCSTSSPRPSSSTGPAAASTASLGRGRKGGRADRPEPDRPRQGRHEVPPARRRSWSDPAHVAVAGEHPRQRAVRAPARDQPRRPRSSPPTRSSPASTRQAARRQGLRLPALPPLPAPAWDQSPHRSPRHRVQQPSRPGPLVVERSISWLLRFKRLGLPYDRTQRTLRPLLTLGCVLINLRRLVQKEF
jgi:hypothetical protein